MADTVIGLLHPGEMGAAVAACLTGRGHQVSWASAGRGPASATRAAQAGLADAGTVAALARQAAIIVSVCPPHAALDTARAVAAAGFTGVFVDANAISPATSYQVGAVVGAAGARFVDGGIIGPPPVPPAPGRRTPGAAPACTWPAAPPPGPGMARPRRSRHSSRAPL